jgi:glycosyltransferase involved in cell wall biosynthesis
MKVLFLSSQALFRDTRFGGAKRLYYMARELEARADLYLVCLDGCNEFPAGTGPDPEFRRMLFLPNKRASLRGRFRFLPGVAETLEEGREKLATFLGETRFDATLLAYPGALRFLKDNLIPFPGKTVYLEDDLLLEQHRKAVERSPSPLRRLVKSWRHLQARRFYQKSLRTVSAFACISPQEAGIARKSHPWLPVLQLGYGVPLEDYPMLPVSTGPLTLGFIGNYGHTPNVDAALWLTSELFPEIQGRFPEARLVVAGTNVPRKLREACEGRLAIRLLENIPEISRFYEGISVFVNAVREGRGLRTKVVEAAAFGRPILSTPLGMEGLESFRVALFEDAGTLVEGLEAFQDARTWQETANYNRLIVESELSMRTIGASLAKILALGPTNCG